MSATSFFGGAFFGGEFFNAGGPSPTPGRSGLGGDDVPRETPHHGWNRSAWLKRKERWDAMEGTLREAYRELIHGPAPVAEEAKAIVEPVMRGETEGMDWKLFAEQWERTRDLLELWEAKREQDDEEAIFMLMH